MKHEFTKNIYISWELVINRYIVYVISDVPKSFLHLFWISLKEGNNLSIAMTHDITVKCFFFDTEILEQF
jgi:hypothetical protein